jgi:alkylation response protein AidB-like acyl-CoA dehydrogenase
VHFGFSDEQRLFQKTMRELVARECPPAHVRSAWTSETGRSPQLWSKLAEVGLVGLTVPSAHGGLGGSALDWVLVLEEAGRGALPEPLNETTVVAAPLLAEIGGDVATHWLPRVANGEAIVTVGVHGALVVDAHVADLLLLRHGDALHAVPRDQVKIAAQTSVDGARRLFRVEWTPTAATGLASGELAQRACADAFDRGALGAAAELVGLGAKLIELTVEYVKVRKQFGQAVGSFQAVKHQLTDALVAVEFARPVVYRAADSIARALPDRATHVSMAKAAASDAASKAARVALQCHGAIGYSFEHDLHLWMKRAWALGVAWGDAAWHRERVATAILDGGKQ